jgi:transmembrane sensor
MQEGDRRAVLEEAADWHFKRDAGPLSPQEASAFARWRADPANRAALDQIERTWADLGDIPRPVNVPTSRWVNAWRPAVGIAAVLALLIAGYSFDLPMRFEANGYTATGETLAMVLDDGSGVLLNTASAIAIDYSTDIRRVRLLRGEAIFTVAKDASRPFLVDTAGGEARALGTAFSVRRDDAGATVTVIESRVGVSYPAGTSPTVELSPGEAVKYSQDGVGTAHVVDADAETAWRRGKLIFVDRPLGAVVDELNRYHSGRIQITDGSISQHLVSGVFDTAKPLLALDDIEKSLGLHSTRLTQYLVLLHR